VQRLLRVAEVKVMSFVQGEFVDHASSGINSACLKEGRYTFLCCWIRLARTSVIELSVMGAYLR
jgi:hypothetical protein